MVKIGFKTTIVTTLAAWFVMGSVIAYAAVLRPGNVSGRLWTELQREQRVSAASMSPTSVQSPNPNIVRFDKTGRIQIDVSHPCGKPIDSVALAAAGFHLSTAVSAPPFCVDEGWVNPNAITNIAALGNVTLVDLPAYSRVTSMSLARYKGKMVSEVVSAASTTIDGNAVSIMKSGQYISQTLTNGSGVTVAVVSDDVTSLATIQGRGELPASLSDYTDYTNWGYNPKPTDEGTMMLEEVHAVAPGATLAFCGPQTAVEYVSCIQTLAANNVNIVADDIGYPGYDLMSDQSSFAQAIANLLQANPNLTLFSASGNDEGGFWQGNYTPTALTVGGSPFTLTCNGQVDQYFQDFGSAYYETLSVSSADSPVAYLQWADPFSSNSSNFDVYVLDTSMNVLACASWSTDNPIPADVIASYPPGSAYLFIGTPDQSLAGKFLKLDLYGDGASSMSITTGGGIDSPQKLVSGVQTIGAVNAADGIGATIEPYSQTGPITLPLATVTTVQAPVFVAPDDVTVDNSGTDFTGNPFAGTSAATPNAAAVAALLESSFPGLSPGAILGYMQSGAAQLGTTVPDGTFGYGRVDAMGTLNAIPAPTMTAIGNIQINEGQSSSAIPFTVSGTGTLVLTGSSDNTALVSFGTSGDVTVTPSNCGQQGYDSCSMTVTPTAGQSGTANLTIYVTDGANRSATSSFSVTVTGASSTTTGGSGSGTTSGGGGGGGAVGILSLLLLSALALRRRLH